MPERDPGETTNLDIYGSAVLPWSRPYEQIEAIVPAPEPLFILSTTRPDGRPHAAGIGVVMIDGDLFFTSGPGTRKSHNLAANPHGVITVRLNDIDVGRTPVEVDFEWYGTYDVRLDHEGYEPLVTSAKADAPVHEWPGIDFVTMALPIRFKDEVRWHFELTPAASDPQAAITRGREVRAMLPVRTTPPGTRSQPAPPREPSPELEPVTEPIEPRRN